MKGPKLAAWECPAKLVTLVYLGVVGLAVGELLERVASMGKHPFHVETSEEMQEKTGWKMYHHEDCGEEVMICPGPLVVG